MASHPQIGLVDAVATLRRAYPVPRPPADPLRLILWENIGYLIDDQRRAELFADFESTVGFDPAEIDAAEDATLMAIALRGGMRPETRVQRWRAIARIVLRDCAGDLAGKLRAVPLTKARALLKTFPVIGDPGADKILLFSGVAPRPSLDSNGLRTLARLGFFAEQASYARNYRAAIEVLEARGRPDGDWLIDAYLALREHGKALCKRGEPLCPACPLDAVCAHARVVGL